MLGKRALIKEIPGWRGTIPREMYHYRLNLRLKRYNYERNVPL
ncbi:hypothetical protein ACOJQI_10855 [Bacillus salacetis]